VNNKLCVRLISAMTLSNDCNFDDTLCSVHPEDYSYPNHNYNHNGDLTLRSAKP